MRPNDCSCRLLGGATDCRDGAFGHSNGNCHHNADCCHSYINRDAGHRADFVAYGCRITISNIHAYAHADFSAYANGYCHACPRTYGYCHAIAYADSYASACVREQAESGASGRYSRDYN